MIVRLNHVKMRAAEAAKQAGRQAGKTEAARESPTEKKPESEIKLQGTVEK